MVKAGEITSRPAHSTAQGEILELQLGDDAVARYDASTAPHDHILCTSCGEIADINVPLPESTTRQAARESGFEVEGYELQFLGRCARCQSRSPLSDRTAR